MGAPGVENGRFTIVTTQTAAVGPLRSSVRAAHAEAATQAQAPGVAQQCRYHPASMICLNGMTLSQPHPVSSQRLADQLQALSVLAESLTIRLLELEERLLAQERRAQPGEDAASQQELELRLEDTDQRLLRIEELLHDLERPATSRHLQEVPRPAAHQGSRTRPSATTATGVEIFPEDGEQPFMDELIA